MVQVQEVTFPFVTDCDTCGDINMVREIEGGGTICQFCDEAEEADEDYEQYLSDCAMREWDDEQADIALLKEEEEARIELNHWLNTKGFLYDTQDKLSGFRVDKNVNTVLGYGRSGGLLRG